MNRKKAQIKWGDGAAALLWVALKTAFVTYFQVLIACLVWAAVLGIHYLAFPAKFDIYDPGLSPHVYFLVSSAPILVGMLLTWLAIATGVSIFQSKGMLVPMIIAWFMVTPGFRGMLEPTSQGFPAVEIVYPLSLIVFVGVLLFAVMNPWLTAVLPRWYRTPFQSKYWMHGAIWKNEAKGLAGRRIALFSGKSTTDDAGEDSRQPSGLKYIAEQPTLRFADVVGMDDLKSRLLAAGKAIVPDKTPGASGGEAVVVRNGILLHGEPGNGKTMFVEALAGELGLPFIRATFGDFASKWVNETTENVTKLFADAKAQAPCVLFIDEVDALLIKRDGARTSDSESTKTVNTALTALVDLRKSGVVIAAATNYLNMLDGASIREGRFDFKIEVPAPDQPAREAIMRARLAKNGVRAIVDADVLKTVAARWKGFSAARITAIVDELATKASGKATLALDDFMDALRTIQGRRGSIPEDTPTLDKMHFPEEVARKLKGLAARMSKIEEIEALGGTVPAGVLFFGPPGTGKTATVRSLAKTTGWALVTASGNDLLSSPSRIDELLKESSELRPCIVFIDEADDILAERGTSPYATTVTNKLLTAIDGASGKVPDVVYIAATNLPDAMDAAALRGGRFTEKIEFALPDAKALMAFVEGWIKGSKARLDAELTPSRIATFLAGLSIANVREILQQAVNLMVERRMEGSTDALVTEQDLIRATESVARFQ